MDTTNQNRATSVSRTHVTKEHIKNVYLRGSDFCSKWNPQLHCWEVKTSINTLREQGFVPASPPQQQHTTCDYYMGETVFWWEPNNDEEQTVRICEGQFVGRLYDNTYVILVHLRGTTRITTKELIIKEPKDISRNITNLPIHLEEL